ncbi:putative Mg2+ transporter-C (MgtC) family protein [Pelagirhabdus alkalitolerans]|uniref:Putative Mg2+ transporter-C (MgtC) family protein n=1 Tax=Pelagirhabdus alkalitolerans TaxID=1612202 RepID=A0A1G6MC64_9BACI|nr:MgtC/SapB family protein [Pelagirhabdus alkalitolerans]SDC53103.1 putative Mg2+ transporter-C (MgtC) family protein [Pelagirhabdus alkalitolerans]
MNAIFDADFFIISTRLILTLILSGAIGYEREVNKHAAGFRTHILVGVGACLMMVMSLYGFNDYVEANSEFIRFDVARIPSYVISGIGFLGAGTIIVNGMTVRGLTTAASIWTVAGLGLVIGIGMYSIAILTTFIILLSLVFLNNFEKVIAKKHHRVQLEIVMNDLTEIDEIFEKYNDYNLVVKNINIQNEHGENAVVTTDLEIGKNTSTNKVYYALLQIDHVKQVKEL